LDTIDERRSRAAERVFGRKAKTANIIAKIDSYQFQIVTYRSVGEAREGVIGSGE
jgi:hypothetical protein